MSSFDASRANRQRRLSVHVGGKCELNCAPCDCRTMPNDVAEAEKTLREGAQRAVLRGSPGTSGDFEKFLRAAREGRVEEVVVRTNAHAYVTEDAARKLAAEGVHVALVPLFSADSALHDRIAGLPGAQEKTVAGVRALRAAGLAIEVETPLLDPSRSTPVQVLDFATSIVPDLRAIHVFLARWRLPGALAPPLMPVIAELVESLSIRARHHHVAFELRDTDALPLCTLATKPTLHALHRFDPKNTAALQPGCAYRPPCETCAVRPQCSGVATSYAEKHGDSGLTPYASKPRTLLEQRTTGRRAWTDEQRRAARDAQILVLRPTVNCNQDCTFCSANETTGNVWTDPEVMYRQVARAARRGIRYLSFSGGEPTLSKDLPRFIHVAKRAGIPKIEIVTNAVLLDRADKVKALRDAGLTHAFVSLHAHDESVSRALTQKVGDFERTVKAVGLLLDAGVSVTLNHVVNARNFPFIPRFIDFVADRFGARAGVSFAFVTPQYKALEHLELVPRLSDVKPFLRRGLHRAIARGVPVVVGSRQGVPPCFLGEFRAWSDVLHLANEGASEDSFQKGQGPQCASCAYAKSCTGLWRPYAAREGFGELVPVPGPAIGDAERAELDARVKENPFGRPLRFDDVPERLRERALESEFASLPEVPEPTAPSKFSLNVLDSARSRPVRVLFAGSGRRARVLAEAMSHVPGLSLDGVASPHAPETAGAAFGHCPTWRELTDAFDDMRPEVVVVASDTASHVRLATAAVERGIPVFIEKPVARSVSEATAFATSVGSRTVLAGHNDRFVPGLDAFLESSGSRLEFARRTGPRSPETPRVWSREAVRELVHHALSMLVPKLGAVTSVVSSSFAGEMAPQKLRWSVAHVSGTSEISFDFTLPVDVLELSSEGHVLRREGRSVTRDGAVVEGPGELVAMFEHLRRVVLDGEKPKVGVDEAVTVLAGAMTLVDALEAAGAPFDRVNAPKHVASRELTGPRGTP